MTRTPAETNQIIHEARGKCWHRHYGRTLINDVCRWKCPFCEEIFGYAEHRDPKPKANPNYLEHGKPWGEMVEWASRQSWWTGFKHSLWEKTIVENKLVIGIPDYYVINPSSLAEHLADYLKKEKSE